MSGSRLEIIDRVIEKLISEGEDLEFPEFIECAVASINDKEDQVIDDAEKPNA